MFETESALSAWAMFTVNQRILHRYNFMVAAKPVQKLGQVLTRVKDNVPMDKQTGIVYAIPCSDCNIQYIRETSRALYRQENKNVNEVLNNRELNSRLWLST